MKLKYWKCKCLDDHDCYSIRAKTRKEAVEIRNEYNPEAFSEPYREEIEYSSGFDLMTQAVGPFGLCEDENEPPTTDWSLT